ncbi:MAG: hypothetical protein ABL879_06125 [Devosia sp.]
MLRPALALPLMLLATGALAQTVPEGADKDLWCGTAFTVAFNIALAPPGTPDAQIEEAKMFTGAGHLLLVRGTDAYLAAGFTQEAVDKIKADLVTHVTEQIGGQGEIDYGFDECTDLIGPLTNQSGSGAPPAEPESSSSSAAEPGSQATSSSAM